MEVLKLVSSDTALNRKRKKTVLHHSSTDFLSTTDSLWNIWWMRPLDHRLGEASGSRSRPLSNEACSFSNITYISEQRFGLFPVSELKYSSLGLMQESSEIFQKTPPV